MSKKPEANEIWTNEEVLHDIEKQNEYFRTNYEKLIQDYDNTNHRLSIAISCLRKYANPLNWLKLGKSKSLYKGCGIKKATAALTEMNKLKKYKQGVVDEM